MQFLTQTQQSCYEDVAALMRQVFGETASAQEDIPVFLVQEGSSVTHVAVYPWGDSSAIVCVRANVVVDVELTPDLLKFLIVENNTMRFGAFGLDDDGDIFFEHAIVAPTCDEEELKASVLAVAGTADRYDDRIASQWGGRKALEP